MTRLQAAPTQAVQTECVCKRWGIWGLASKWPPTLPFCLPFAFFSLILTAQKILPIRSPIPALFPFSAAGEAAAWVRSMSTPPTLCPGLTLPGRPYFCSYHDSRSAVSVPWGRMWFPLPHQHMASVITAGISSHACGQASKAPTEGRGNPVGP